MNINLKMDTHLAAQLFFKPWRNKKPWTHILRLLLTPNDIYKKKKIYFNISYITYKPRSGVEEGMNGTYINFQLQVNVFPTC